MSSQPPASWRVEIQGLTPAVVFTHPDGRQVLWTPEGWWSTSAGVSRPADLPSAGTLRDARRVGTEWLHDLAIVE